jgi:hypothetical protein
MVGHEFIATQCRRKASIRRKQQKVPRKFDPQSEAEKIDRREQSLDDALRGTFPASDPPAALAPHCPQK